MPENTDQPGANDPSGNAQGAGNANSGNGRGGNAAVRQARRMLEDAQQHLKDLLKQGTKGSMLDNAKEAVKKAEKDLERLTSGSVSDRRDARQEYMDQYFDRLGGPWVAELFKRDPELSQLIEVGMKNGWSANDFLLGKDGKPGLYETKWWNDSKKSASWKQAFKWEFAPDKTEWNSKLDLAKQTIRTLAKSLYSMDVSEEDLDRLARRYWYNGWSEFDNQGLRTWLASVHERGYIGDKPEDGGGFAPGGTYLTQERALRDAARNYGVWRPDSWYSDTAQKILDPSKNFTADDAWNQIISDAESMYPVFQGKLSKDVSVRDVAAGYISQLSRYLEINDPNLVDLSDPLLQKAFTNLDDKSQPTLMPLWQFTQQIKKDPRWQYTANALDTYSTIGSDLARMMGFVR